jgi:hypothetical protein
MRRFTEQSPTCASLVLAVTLLAPPDAQSIENEPRQQGTGNRARGVGNSVQERRTRAPLQMTEPLVRRS